MFDYVVSEKVEMAGIEPASIIVSYYCFYVCSLLLITTNKDIKSTDRQGAGYAARAKMLVVFTGRVVLPVSPL